MATTRQSALTWTSLALLLLCAAVVLWPGPKQERLIRKGLAGEVLPLAREHAPPTSTVPPPPEALPQAASVRGVVLGDKEEPVPGARVYWIDGKVLTVPESAASSTDGAGRFEVGVVHPQEGTSLRVVAAGFLPWTEAVDAGTGADLRIVLRRGETIRGEVVDIWGRGVEGARVWCHSPRNRIAWPNPTNLLPADRELECLGGESATDREGKFALTGLDTGQYEVRASKSYYGYVGSDLPPIVASHTDGVTLVLAPLARLVVRAVDERTRARLPLAHLSMLLRGGVSQTLDVLTHECSTEGDQVDTPRAPDGSSVMTFAAGKLPSGVAESISGAKVIAQAPGYEEKRIVMDLPFGKTTLLEMPLVSRPSGGEIAPRPVALTAECVGGKAFSGAMYFEIRESGLRGVSGLWGTTFIDGRPQDELALPEGQYTLEPIGPLGASGAFALSGWGGPVTVGVGSNGTGGNGRVVLSTNPVRLVVRDARGRLLGGFDLSVNTVNSGGLSRRWDIRRRRESPGARDCIVWLPAGDIALAVSMPGHSREVRRIAIPGDGRLLECEVTLAEDRREPTLSDPERR